MTKPLMKLKKNNSDILSFAKYENASSEEYTNIHFYNYYKEIGNYTLLLLSDQNEKNKQSNIF